MNKIFRYSFSVLSLSFILASMLFANEFHHTFRVNQHDDDSVMQETMIEQVDSLVQGKASFYGSEFNGRKTANGEIYDETALTAAHRTLPFGTVLRVTNLRNGLSVIVRINDRGPFHPDRVLDISKSAAEEIDLIRFGVTEIEAEILEQ
jgi:rare lipoprotein A